jgi:hypothetical protein
MTNVQIPMTKFEQSAWSFFCKMRTQIKIFRAAHVSKRAELKTFKLSQRARLSVSAREFFLHKKRHRKIVRVAQPNFGWVLTGTRSRAFNIQSARQSFHHNEPVGTVSENTGPYGVASCCYRNPAVNGWATLRRSE